MLACCVNVHLVLSPTVPTAHAMTYTRFINVSLKHRCLLQLLVLQRQRLPPRLLSGFGLLFAVVGKAVETAIAERMRLYRDNAAHAQKHCPVRWK